MKGEEKRKENSEFCTKTWAKNSDLFPCATGFDGIKKNRIQSNSILCCSVLGYRCDYNIIAKAFVFLSSGGI